MRRSCESPVGARRRFRHTLPIALVLVLAACGGPSREELQGLRSGALDAKAERRLAEMLDRADDGRYEPALYADVVETLAQRIPDSPGLRPAFIRHCRRVIEEPQVWRTWERSGLPLDQLLDYQRAWALQAWWRSGLDGALEQAMESLRDPGSGLQTTAAALSVLYESRSRLEGGGATASAIYRLLPPLAARLDAMPAAALSYRHGPMVVEAGTDGSAVAVGSQLKADAGRLLVAVRARYRDPETLCRVLEQAVLEEEDLVLWALSDAARWLTVDRTGDPAVDALVEVVAAAALRPGFQTAHEVALGLVHPAHDAVLAAVCAGHPLALRDLGTALAVLPQAGPAAVPLRRTIARQLAGHLPGMPSEEAGSLLAGFLAEHPHLLARACAELAPGHWDALPGPTAHHVLAALVQLELTDAARGDLGSAHEALVRALPAIGARADAEDLLATIARHLPEDRRSHLVDHLERQLERGAASDAEIALAARLCADGGLPPPSRLPDRLGCVLLVDEDPRRAAVAAAGLQGAATAALAALDDRFSALLLDPPALRRALDRWQAYHHHLGSTVDEQLIERLFAAAPHPDPEISRCAIEALGRLIPTDDGVTRRRLDVVVAERWPLVER